MMDYNHFQYRGMSPEQLDIMIDRYKENRYENLVNEIAQLREQKRLFLEKINTILRLVREVHNMESFARSGPERLAALDVIKMDSEEIIMLCKALLSPYSSNLHNESEQV